jgi:diguanylate cyclase (GGDEF)-like protein
VSKADELRLLREAINSFPDAVAVWDAEGRLVACNDAYRRVAASAPAGGAAPEHLRSVRSLAGGGKLEVIADATELRRAEQANRLLAYHDAATGLPNRRLLDDRLRQAIHLAQRRDRMVALVLVHLDQFRQGDAALRELAERLSRCVRKADTLARCAADEFALVLTDLKDAADSRIVADKVVRTLAPRFAVSIGIALFPADGADAEALLRNADAARFRARALGGSASPAR